MSKDCWFISGCFWLKNRVGWYERGCGDGEDAQRQHYSIIDVMLIQSLEELEKMHEKGALAHCCEGRGVLCFNTGVVITTLTSSRYYLSKAV